MEQNQQKMVVSPKPAQKSLNDIAISATQQMQSLDCKEDKPLDGITAVPKIISPVSETDMDFEFRKLLLRNVCIKINDEMELVEFCNAPNLLEEKPIENGSRKMYEKSTVNAIMECYRNYQQHHLEKTFQNDNPKKTFEDAKEGDEIQIHNWGKFLREKEGVKLDLEKCFSEMESKNVNEQKKYVASLVQKLDDNQLFHTYGSILGDWKDVDQKLLNKAEKERTDFTEPRKIFRFAIIKKLKIEGKEQWKVKGGISFSCQAPDSTLSPEERRSGTIVTGNPGIFKLRHDPASKTCTSSDLTPEENLAAINAQNYFFIHYALPNYYSKENYNINKISFETSMHPLNVSSGVLQNKTLSQSVNKTYPINNVIQKTQQPIIRTEYGVRYVYKIPLNDILKQSKNNKLKLQYKVYDNEKELSPIYVSTESDLKPNSSGMIASKTFSSKTKTASKFTAS